MRILDISYGGLRLEMERTPKERLPRSLSMTLPTSNVAIDVNVVWQKPSGESGWLCGAAIPDTSQPTWRQLVDAVSLLSPRAHAARLSRALSRTARPRPHENQPHHADRDEGDQSDHRPTPPSRPSGLVRRGNPATSVPPPCRG